MKIQTKQGAKQFLQDFETHFIIRKSQGFAYFPIAYRGHFGKYAMIYYYYESGEWEAKSSVDYIYTTELHEIEAFIWKKKEEINYTLHKPSICTCPNCDESRWYAVQPSYRGHLSRALCGSCLHSFDLEAEVEDEYYSLP